MISETEPISVYALFDSVECHFVYFLSFQERAQKRQREEMRQIAVPPSFSLVKAISTRKPLFPISGLLLPHRQKARPI